MEEAVLAVVKRSSVREPFSRSKIEAGVRKACQGRPVDDDAIAALAQGVEETIRARGIAEVSSQDVGLAILGPLRDLDEVAYLRFASVYKGFESLADFEHEIAALMSAPGTSGQPASVFPQVSAEPVRLREMAGVGNGTPNSGTGSYHGEGGRGE
jgi:transcriptional repressor NrdR